MLFMNIYAQPYFLDQPACLHPRLTAQGPHTYWCCVDYGPHTRVIVIKVQQLVLCKSRTKHTVDFGINDLTLVGFGSRSTHLWVLDQ